MGKDSLRKDFEVFSKGIQRLEELKKELDSLNTKGHEAEVASIRAKLKNVSDIPIIEQELKRLRGRISGKYKPKKKKSVTGERIQDLEKEIAKKSSIDRKQSKEMKEIPKLKKDLVGLREKLRKEMHEEKRKKEMLIRIDPSIDLISNEAFNLSLNEIKAELSRRIKDKETNMQNELNDDLKTREEIFKKKYQDIEKKYHQDYEEALRTTMKKEIEQKLDKLVDVRIKEKKVDLSKKELHDLRKQAEKEILLERENMKKRFMKDLEEAKRSMKAHFEEELLMHKHEVHREFEKSILDEVRRLKKKYSVKEEEMVRKKESQAEAEALAVEKELRRKKEELSKELKADYEERLKEEVRKKQCALEAKKAELEKEIQRKARALLG